MPGFPGAIFILAAALALPTANGAEVNVYAAASLTDVLKDIAANYEKQSKRQNSV
jgi:ABC-type molybdate transport system substrate-binding protein